MYLSFDTMFRMDMWITHMALHVHLAWLYIEIDRPNWSLNGSTTQTKNR